MNNAADATVLLFGTNCRRTISNEGIGGTMKLFGGCQSLVAFSVTISDARRTRSGIDNTSEANIVPDALRSPVAAVGCRISLHACQNSSNLKYGMYNNETD